MNAITIMFAVGVTLIVTYLAASIARFGIPPSISDTHYLWAEAVPNVIGRSMFTLAIVGTVLGILPYWLSCSLPNWQWLAFVGAGALAFVGTAAAFNETLTHAVHYGGAFTWAGASVIWVAIHAGFAPILLGAIVAAIGLVVQHFANKTFWLEIGCIVLLLLGLVI